MGKSSSHSLRRIWQLDPSRNAEVAAKGEEKVDEVEEEQGGISKLLP